MRRSPTITITITQTVYERFNDTVSGISKPERMSG